MQCAVARPVGGKTRKSTRWHSESSISSLRRLFPIPTADLHCGSRRARLPSSHRSTAQRPIWSGRCPLATGWRWSAKRVTAEMADALNHRIAASWHEIRAAIGAIATPIAKLNTCCGKRGPLACWKSFTGRARHIRTRYGTPARFATVTRSSISPPMPASWTRSFPRSPDLAAADTASRRGAASELPRLQSGARHGGVPPSMRDQPWSPRCPAAVR